MRRLVRPLAIASVVIGGAAVARRLGHKVGGNVIVRCSKGHLFTTIWIPGGSFKAIRLGWYRFQHCPVGNHWALVRPVKDADLTDADRRIAAGSHDLRIP